MRLALFDYRVRIDADHACTYSACFKVQLKPFVPEHRRQSDAGIQGAQQIKKLSDGRLIIPQGPLGAGMVH